MLPDCIAMEYKRAKQILQQAGVSSLETSVTKPPRGGAPCGDARVVRQTFDTKGTCHLLLAYREYGEG